ncbi:MAG TPA: class I SAM-dependent methyltransferase, partial [Pirellulales bacterium]
MSVIVEHDDATAVARPSSEPPGWACDLCGGLRRRPLHQWPVGDAWNPASIELCVWQCETCRLVCLHPVPAAHELPNAGDWWSGSRRRPRRWRWIKQLRESLRRALLGSSAERLVRATHRLLPRGRFLEVGCGDGMLLPIVRRYYAEVVGLEPSPLGAAKARQRGLQVIESTFEAADVPPESFDVILMDAVIEHLGSPLAVLRQANGILRPGGVIVMRTPKFGGPAYRMHGRAWNGFRHGYHTFLFDGSTLGALLEKAGFEVLRKPRRDRPL